MAAVMNSTFTSLCGNMSWGKGAEVSIRVVFAAILIGCSVGCQSLPRNQRVPESSTTDTILIEEDNVSVLLRSIDSSRKRQESLRKMAAGWPDSTRSAANKARENTCSDKDYIRALRCLSDALLRRNEAICKETEVYRRWLFRDDIERLK